MNKPPKRTRRMLVPLLVVLLGANGIAWLHYADEQRAAAEYMAEIDAINDNTHHQMYHSMGVEHTHKVKEFD